MAKQEGPNDIVYEVYVEIKDPTTNIGNTKIYTARSAQKCKIQVQLETKDDAAARNWTRYFYSNNA